MIAGIDEAGRGAVIGPLCIALVCGGERDFSSLKLADSKMLTRKQREDLYPEIRKRFYTAHVLIHASELNELMKRFSLNEIEAMKAGFLLNEMPAQPERIYVDSPDPHADNFRLRMLRHMSKRMDICAEHKADVNYPIVSAASIVAKVVRDWEIDKIRDKVGIEFSSGYPSDESTVKAVKKMLKSSDGKKYVRMRWSTVERIMANQKKLHDYF